MQCFVCEKEAASRCTSCRRTYCSQTCALIYHYGIPICGDKRESEGEESSAKRRKKYVEENHLDEIVVELPGAPPVPVEEMDYTTFEVFRLAFNAAMFMEKQAFHALCSVNKRFHVLCRDTTYSVRTKMLVQDEYSSPFVTLQLRGILLVVDYARSVSFYIHRLNPTHIQLFPNSYESKNWNLQECALARNCFHLLKYIDENNLLKGEPEDYVKQGRLRGITYSGSQAMYELDGDDVFFPNALPDAFYPIYYFGEDIDPETLISWLEELFLGNSTYLIERVDGFRRLIGEVGSTVRRHSPKEQLRKYRRCISIVCLYNVNNEEMLNYLLDMEEYVIALRSDPVMLDNLRRRFFKYTSVWKNHNELTTRFDALFNSFGQPPNEEPVEYELEYKWPPWSG